MDEQARQQFDEIREVLASIADSLRQTQVKQDRSSEMIAANAEAISQLTQAMEQTRQTIVDERLLISDLRAEQARHAQKPDAHGPDE